MYAWFKKWFLDGWLTEGPQFHTPPELHKSFARCHGCGAIWPHWWSNVTAEEFKTGKPRPIGCQKCGNSRLFPCLIPAWKSVWWFFVRGMLIRKVILKKRLWDPRIPVMQRDRT